MLLSAFRHGYIDNADLHDLEIERISFEWVYFAGSSFNNAKIIDCEFYIVSAFEVDFTGSQILRSKFRGGFFDSANFSNCNLSGSSFLTDNLGGCVHLDGADFSTADLTGVDFSGAKVSSETKFPSGFDHSRIGSSASPRLNFVGDA